MDASIKSTKAKTVIKATGAGTQAKVKKPSRKKKTTSKTASAAATQAILSGSRTAQADLTKQKLSATARKYDPLWFKIEDVVSVSNVPSAMSEKSSLLPEQTQIVEAVLGQFGLCRSDVTPQAMACLLEQARRFSHDLVADAQDFAYAANRTELTKADLVLAFEMRADRTMGITAQIPKLNLVAQQVNRSPLPPIPSQCYSGVLLPPKQHQLTARTYDIVSSSQTEKRIVQNPPEPKKKIPASSTSQPGYGATKGRQINVTLQSSSKSQTIPTAVSQGITSNQKDDSGKNTNVSSAPIASTAASSTTTTSDAK